MKQILIRNFEENDLRLIQKIIKKNKSKDNYFAQQLEHINKLCFSDIREVFVAAYQEIIVGFIQAEHYQWNRLSYLQILIVDLEFERYDIAKKLVEQLEISAKNRQQRGIYIITRADNLEDKKFYTSIGFNQAYIMPKFYKAELDGVTFQKFFHKKLEYNYDALIDKSQIIKQNLAYAYQILSYLKLDDHTYTHLSARSNRGFYIYPFGLLFSEVTPENLLEVTLDGQILIGCEYQYNKTGYIIHGEIYKKRPDINAIFHIHTPEIVAVSAHKHGMMPVSQWALHFYNKIAYHSYDSLALNSQQGSKIADDLKDHFTMLMRNHGSITCGKTIQEALFYTYHLQQACKTQCMMQCGYDIIIPSHEIAKNTVSDLLSFEENLGQRDWQAWLRLIQTLKTPL